MRGLVVRLALWGAADATDPKLTDSTKSSSMW